MRSRVIAPLSVALVAAFGLAAPTTAAVPADTDAVTAPAASATTTYTISGRTLAADGTKVHYVDVAAIDPTTGEREASAISYGGHYELVVEPGSYLIQYRDLDNRFVGLPTALLPVTVKADVKLPVVKVVRRAPASLASAALGGAKHPNGVIVFSPGVWARTPQSVTYQWTRNGQPIKGATGSTYRVLPGDVGDRIAAKAVVSWGAGYEPATLTAPAVRIGKGDAKVTAKPNSRSVAVGKRAVVTVRVAAADNRRPVGKVLVKSGARTLGKATLRAAKRGVVRVVLPKLSAGSYRLTVTYSGSGVTYGARSKVFTLTVRR
ncbi:Ig-like domain-containing protein [Nocardioides pakistanensis]